jgi:hypothetical protein
MMRNALRIAVAVGSLFAAVVIVTVTPALAGNGTTAGGGSFAKSASAPPQTTGSAGGKFIWFDVANISTTRTLTWPNNYTLATDTAAWGNNDDLKLKAQSYLGLDVLGASGNDGKLFWKNVCATATGRSAAIPGTAPGSECLGSFSSEGQIDYEMHSTTPAGGIGQMGQIVAWNVEIFRAPRVYPVAAHYDNPAGKKTHALTPIWARQIGINGKSDGPGISNSQWWKGGPGGSATATTQTPFAGPIGAMDGSTNPQQPCKTRNTDAQRFVTSVRSYAKAHNDPILADYENAASLDTSNTLDANSCYWNITIDNQPATPNETLLGSGANHDSGTSGTTGPSYNESILITSTVGVQGKATLTYKFAGMPNRAYVLVATAIDSREQLVNPGLLTQADQQAGYIPQGTNYFRAFVPGAATCKLADSGKLWTDPDPTDNFDTPPGYTNPISYPGGPYPICSRPPPPKNADCLIGTTTYNHSPIPAALPAPYFWQRSGKAWTCNKPGTTTSSTTHSPPTAPLVTLVADSPVPTRVWARQTVQVKLPNGLASDQAVIPDTATLNFFTPQSANNGSTNGCLSSYSKDYVRFDSDSGLFSRRAAPFAGPGGTPVCRSVLTQPAQLGQGGGSDLLLAQNDFRISWLQPTLDNPCGFNADGSQVQVTQDPLTGQWPTDPRACFVQGPKAAPRNAWDDVITASTTYEQRWVADSNNPNDNVQGWVSGQPLRCNNPFGPGGNGPTIDLGSCNSLMTFTDYSGPDYLAADANKTRHAQGYLNVANDAQGGPGAAAISLDTNLTGNISSRQLWNRATGAQIDTNGGRTNETNPATGKPTADSLYYCEPGLPAGATVATGATGVAADRSVARDWQGDQTICKGYTLAWSWAQTTPQYNVQDACSTIAGSPASSRFHSPSLDIPVGTNGLASGVRDWALLYGDYKTYNANPLYDGNPDWTALLKEADAAANGQKVATIPYDGNRPGNAAGESPGNVSYPTGTNCHKQVTVGDHADSYASGQWFIDHVTNETVLVGYQQKCVKWQQIPIKNAKGKIIGYKNGACTKSVDDLTKPITKTVSHNVYDFRLTGSAYPTNQDAQAITRTPLNRGGVSLMTDAHDRLQASWQSGLVKVLQADPSNWLNWGSPYAPANLAPDWSNLGWAGFSTQGYIQDGTWGRGNGAGPGFGSQQTGYRLDKGGFIADWTLANLMSTDLATGSYRLTASYDGYPNWKWQTREAMVAPANAVKSVAVFATRDAR